MAPGRFRVGEAADLPDDAAFDAYVGPVGEITIDFTRSILAAHDGATPGGVRTSQGGNTGGITGVAPYPQSRLSLVQDIAVSESDVAGATTIYFVPCGGTLVPISDGTGYSAKDIGSGLSLALDDDSAHDGYHQSGQNFDLFVFDDAGTVRAGSGPAWASDIVRGAGAGSTELSSASGLFVNANTIILRFGSAAGDTVSVPTGQATYLGSFRATADGQATDTKARRLLFNAFNKTMLPLGVRDLALSWAYSTATYRQANGSAANRIEVLMGLTGSPVSLSSCALVGFSAANQYAQIGIGLDSVTVPSVGSLQGAFFTGPNAVPNAMLSAKFDGFVGLGFHYLASLEAGCGAGTQTWRGTNNDTSFKTGMSGSFLG